MSESKSRSLKIALSKTDLNGQYGDDIKFTADLSTVKDVITGAVGAIGPENCLKLGGGAAAATAFYVLARSITKNWPWLKTTNVEMDVLEVSVPPRKEKQFTELMKKNVLEQQLVQDFENLDINLEDILGEETFDQCGEHVLKLLKDIRIKSIGQNVPDLPKNLIAKKVIRGNVKEKLFDNHDLLVCGEHKGSVIETLVDSGANVEQEIHNSSSTMTVGLQGDDLQRVLDAQQQLAGGSILVKILVEEKEETFERKFKPTTTIYEVSLALKKEEKKLYRLFRDDKELDRESTLAEAARTGSAVSWKARV